MGRSMLRAAPAIRAAIDSEQRVVVPVASGAHAFADVVNDALAWYKGQRHYSGAFWSAIERDLVIYESRLELARACCSRTSIHRSVVLSLSRSC